MDKFEKFFKKYGIIIAVGLLIVLFFRGCGGNSTSFERNEVLLSRVDSLELSIKSLPTTNEVRTMLKIEGLKTEKSTLLNTNQIFLTNKRPDERVMEIDKELEKLQ